jgi:excisionase family DNA binding protein
MTGRTLPLAPGERMLKPREASERLGIAPKTLVEWARASKIATTRTPGGHRLYPQVEVDRLLAAMTEAGQ